MVALAFTLTPTYLALNNLAAMASYQASRNLVMAFIQA